MENSGCINFWYSTVEKIYTEYDPARTETNVLWIIQKASIVLMKTFGTDETTRLQIFRTPNTAQNCFAQIQ